MFCIHFHGSLYLSINVIQNNICRSGRCVWVLNTETQLPSSWHLVLRWHCARTSRRFLDIEAQEQTTTESNGGQDGSFSLSFTKNTKDWLSALILPVSRRWSLEIGIRSQNSLVMLCVPLVLGVVDLLVMYSHSTTFVLWPGYHPYLRINVINFLTAASTKTRLLIYRSKYICQEISQSYSLLSTLFCSSSFFSHFRVSARLFCIRDITTRVLLFEFCWTNRTRSKKEGKIISQGAVRPCCEAPASGLIIQSLVSSPHHLHSQRATGACLTLPRRRNRSHNVTRELRLRIGHCLDCDKCKSLCVALQRAQTKDVSVIQGNV